MNVTISLLNIVSPSTPQGTTSLMMKLKAMGYSHHQIIGALSQALQRGWITCVFRGYSIQEKCIRSIYI